MKATPRTWAGLVVLALPMLLLAIDGTVLVFALPEISADLSPTATQQLWIMDIYSFMLAGLLVTMGGVGDRIGRKKLLLIGATVFTAASVAGAFSPSAEMLIVARALLGLAGATIMPSTLALIRSMFRDRHQRRIAIAVWSAAGTIGAAAGPVVGGWLLEHFWWGSAFLMNIPIMVILLVAGPLLLEESRDPNPGQLDLISALMSLVAMLSAVYALKSLTIGDTPVAISLLFLAMGLVFGWWFVRRQLHLPYPLLDVHLFANRGFTGAVVSDLLGIFALVGSIFALTQYLQLVAGLSPLTAGLWLLPVMAVAGLSAFAAAALVKRFSPALLVSVGLGVSAVGFLLLVALQPDSGALPVAIGLSLIGLGGGIAMTLTNDVIMSSVAPERAGSAAAISETAYELGTALGTAVLGSVLAAVYAHHLLFTHHPGPSVPQPALEQASTTIAEAFAVAATVPGEATVLLTEAARASFTDALNTTAGVGAAVMALAAVWAAVTLRGTSATGDLHESMDLHDQER